MLEMNDLEYNLKVIKLARKSGSSSGKRSYDNLVTNEAEIEAKLFASRGIKVDEIWMDLP